MEGYVIVEAQNVNSGISTLSGSGTAWEDGEGEQPNTYWLYWSYTTDVTGMYSTGGYTGQHWYENDPNNYLLTGWSNYAGRGNYSETLDGFKQWLVKTNPENLDDILGPWPSNMKQAFIDSHYGGLREDNCLRLF